MSTDREQVGAESQGDTEREGALREVFCPHCEHFADWHQGLPFNGGPSGEWRYRCQCGCTVDLRADGSLRLLDRDTLEPAMEVHDA